MHNFSRTASGDAGMTGNIQENGDDPPIFPADALAAAGFDAKRGESFCGGDGGHFLRNLKLFAQRRGEDSMRARR